MSAEDWEAMLQLSWTDGSMNWQLLHEPEVDVLTICWCTAEYPLLQRKWGVAGGNGHAGLRTEHPLPRGPLQTWLTGGGSDLSGSSIREVSKTLPERRPLTEALLRCRRIITTNKPSVTSFTLRVVPLSRFAGEMWWVWAVAGAQRQLHVRSSSRSAGPRIRKWKCHDGSGQRGAEVHKSISEGATGAMVRRESSSSWFRMSRPSPLDCSNYLHID